MNRHWASEVAIGDFCITGSGGTPNRSTNEYFGGSIPWVKSGELREGVITRAEEYITDLGLDNSSAKLVPAGALLLAMYGATVGRLAILGIEAATNQAICNIRPDPRQGDVQYLFHALQAKVPQLIGMASGGAQPNISQDKIRNTRVRLPPLDEQRRIAAILEKADALRQKRKRALALLQSLTQSVFIESFCKSASQPALKPLGEVSTKITDGTHQAPNWADSGVPFLFVSNVRNQTLSMKTEKYVSELEYQRLTKNTSIDAGDVLYTVVGSYGHAAVVPEGSKFAFQRHIAQIKPDRTEINPFFLSAALESSDARRQADALARGNAQKTIPLSALKKITIPVPPVGQQDRFSDLVRSVAAQMRVEQAAMSRFDTLFAALQHRAFSGQL